MLDLDEDRVWDEATLRVMQRMKTGALFAYAAEAGAILAGASGEDRDRLRRFGAHFGAAFQLADDLDDAAGDDAAGRPSLVALLGPDAAQAYCSGKEVEAAAALLAPYGDRGAVLRAAGRFSPALRSAQPRRLERLRLALAQRLDARSRRSPRRRSGGSSARP